MTFIGALILSLSACVSCLRCGAVLCDSLMWRAPCHQGRLEQAPSATETGPQGAAPSQSPLLRSDVEALCDTIVNGMKVGLVIPTFNTSSYTLSHAAQLTLDPRYSAFGPAPNSACCIPRYNATFKTMPSNVLGHAHTYPGRCLCFMKKQQMPEISRTQHQVQPF